MKTAVLPVVAAVLACLLAPPASAAPAEDAAVAATTTSAPPSGPAGPIPIGPIGHALDTFVREAPERVKTLQDSFRKNAGAIRERVRGGLSRVIGTAGVETTTKAHHHSEAPSTTAITATTTAAPPVDPTASKPPTGPDTAAPTTPGNVPDITTTQKPESRTLIGAPKRCGPNMKADRNGRCREVYQDADEEA